MIIQSFTSSKSPFESPFVIAPEKDDHTQGHITVMIGENGVRKSLALRLLMDAALDEANHKGYGHPAIPVEIECAGCKPRKVIAISLTPWDRFPRSWALSELATSIPWFADRFTYIGPRSREGMVSARYNEAAFGRALFENRMAFQQRCATLAPIFERLGLSVAVGIRFGRLWNPRRRYGRVICEQSVKQLREWLAQRLRKINSSEDFSDHWKRAIADFVQKFSTENVESLWRALEESSSPKITCWITQDGPKFALGFESVEEWRCALYLGLFEVNGVFFATQGATLPKGAKQGALRESDMSSGQWNWLYNFVSLCIELDDDSLVLIDEPENSLHPTWQRDFVSTLSAILKCCVGCHAIVATHSALIASGVRDGFGNIRRLALRESNTEGKPPVKTTVSEAPPLDSYGAQVDDVYRELFELESTRAPEFVARVDDLLGRIRDACGKRPVVPKDDLAYIQDACERLPAHDPMRGILRAIADSVVTEALAE